MVARMRDVWPSLSDTLSLEDEHRAAVTAHMERVPLFRASSKTGAPARRTGRGSG